MSKNVATAEFVTITPKMADAMLVGANIRKIIPNVRNFYAQEIKAGRWHTNGESIKFDRDGNLVDGQHRLHAVLQAQKPITALVVRGVTQDGVDEGRNRTAKDLIDGMGATHAVAKAAAAKVLYWMFNDNIQNAWHGKRVQNAELMAFYSSLDLDALTHCCTIGYRLTSLFPASVTVPVIYQVRNHPKMLPFFDAIATGEDMRAGDPTFELRRWALRRRDSGNLFLGESGRRDAYCAIVHAWNAYLNGDNTNATKLTKARDKYVSVKGCEKCFEVSA